VKSFQEVSESKSINIEYQNNATEKILSDQTYLGRILDNLLSNAIKFSPKVPLFI